MYPVRWGAAGEMSVDTYLGDYPQYASGQGSPGWMLLSLKKPTNASSTLSGHPMSLAVNEDMRTWWSAATGSSGEWFSVDLGAVCGIHAVQTNFADEGASYQGILTSSYEYTIEIGNSTSADSWKIVHVRGADAPDAPHDYVELAGDAQPAFRAQFVRILSQFIPAGGKFSLSGLRVFGHCPGDLPASVESVRAT